jgi:hypothetical protein
MVAASRALATRSADALIDDPYAEPLVRQAERSGDHMAVRTPFEDDFSLDAVRDGILEVVILAPRLGTRATDCRGRRTPSCSRSTCPNCWSPNERAQSAGHNRRVTSDEWTLPEGAHDIRLWTVTTPDGFLVAGMSSDMFGELSAHFGTEAAHWAREVASQARRLDDLGSDDDRYPQYETSPAPTFLNSAVVRFEGIGAGMLWAFYPDDPVPPVIEV